MAVRAKNFPIGDDVPVRGTVKTPFLALAKKWVKTPFFRKSRMINLIDAYAK
jgi:hypothetical protein